MKNIILIGFMGAGKTSFGKWLAKQKRLTFLDTDVMIEEEEKTTINEIFAGKGEEYFRDLETGLVERLLEEGKEGMVLSVGGGLAVRERNRELLRKLGTVVYLRASVDTLCERLEGDKTRPLLKGGSVREKIIELMERRSALYEAGAEKIVDTDGKRFEDILEMLEA